MTSAGIARHLSNRQRPAPHRYSSSPIDSPPQPPRLVHKSHVALWTPATLPCSLGRVKQSINRFHFCKTILTAAHGWIATGDTEPWPTVKYSRGCFWYYRGSAMGGWWSPTGDSPSFDVQQKDREWYVLSYDTTIRATALIDARDFVHGNCQSRKRDGLGHRHTHPEVPRPPPNYDGNQFMKRAVPRMPPPAP